MNHESATLKNVMVLLWQGKPQEARALLNESIQKTKIELNALMQLLATLPPMPVPPRELSSAEELDTKRRAVVTAAKWVAEKNDGLAPLQAVVTRLADTGYEFGVAVERRGTSVGNILLKSDSFESAGPGLYKLIEPQLIHHL